MQGFTTVLMYHEIVRRGRRAMRHDPGYLRYVLTEDLLQSHFERLLADGYRGISIGAMVDDRHVEPAVAITFDDGAASDALIAAPLLLQAGWSATFYVTVNVIGQKGFLTARDLRELHRTGFEVASHTLSHAYLPALGTEAALREIAHSRDRLEQLLGAEVRHLSCPGGRWSPGVARLARAAGYATVATSRPGVHRAGDDVFRIPRIAMRNATSAAFVARVAAGNGLLNLKLREWTLQTVRRVIGNSLYEMAVGHDTAATDARVS
jgi:peptidoglycan/xylan/chitin deacetylase (PgdA/CDA1 family)